METAMGFDLHFWWKRRAMEVGTPGEKHGKPIELNIKNHSATNMFIRNRPCHTNLCRTSWWPEDHALKKMTCRRTAWTMNATLWTGDMNVTKRGSRWTMPANLKTYKQHNKMYAGLCNHATWRWRPRFLQIMNEWHRYDLTQSWKHLVIRLLLNRTWCYTGCLPSDQSLVQICLTRGANTVQWELRHPADMMFVESWNEDMHPNWWGES